MNYYKFLKSLPSNLNHVSFHQFIYYIQLMIVYPTINVIILLKLIHVSPLRICFSILLFNSHAIVLHDLPIILPYATSNQHSNHSIINSFIHQHLLFLLLNNVMIVILLNAFYNLDIFLNFSGNSLRNCNGKHGHKL